LSGRAAADREGAGGARAGRAGRPGAVRARLRAPPVALFLCLFAGQSGALVLSPILVEVARDFGTSSSTAGLLRAFTGLVAGTTAVLLGWPARRLALRDLLVAGAALLALGSALSAAAPTFWALALAQVPTGVALAILLAAGVAGATEWAAPEQRPRVLAWALAGQPAAWIVGMPLAGAVAETTWRLAFLAVPLVASLLALFALSGCIAGPHARAATGTGLVAVLREPAVARWAAGELLAFSAWTGTLVYAGALLVESYGTSPTVTGLVLAGVAVAYLPGNFLVRRMLPTGLRPLLIGLALAGAVGVVLLGSLRPSLGASVAILCALGFVGGGRTLAGSAFGLDVAADRRLGITGARAAATQYGYLVGAGVGGAAVAVAGYTGLGVVLGSLFALAAVPHLLPLRRVRSEPS
jgi:predicted MFS family arabinose efflux permease